MTSTAILAQGTKFEIEGATVGTFVEIGNVKTWNRADGSASEIDTTNLKSTAKESRTGLQDFGKLTLSVNPDFEDAGQVICRTAKAASAVKPMQVTYPDGTVATFSASVLSMPESGGVDGVIEGSIEFKITGTVTITTA